MLVTLALVPGAASAECVPVDLPGLFRLARDDGRPQAVVLGQIRDMRLLSAKYIVVHNTIPGRMRRYVAFLDGSFGTGSGFTLDYLGELSIRSVDIPRLTIPFTLPPENVPAIFFVEKTRSGWVLDAGGCGGLWAIVDRPGDVEAAERCLMRGGDC